MLDRNSIFHALFYGETNVGEMNMEKSTLHSTENKKANALYEILQEKMDEEQHKLLDEFLQERSAVQSHCEEDKFKQGFILGMRIMLETMQDKAFHHYKN